MGMTEQEIAAMNEKRTGLTAGTPAKEEKKRGFGWFKGKKSK